MADPRVPWPVYGGGTPSVAEWSNLQYRAIAAEQRVRELEGALAMWRIQRDHDPLERIARAIALLEPYSDVRMFVKAALVILRGEDDVGDIDRAMAPGQAGFTW